MNKTLFIVSSILIVLFLTGLIILGGLVGTKDTAIKLEEKVVESLSNINVERKNAANKLTMLQDSLDDSNARYTEVMTAIAEARKSDASIDQVQFAINVVMEAYPEGDANNKELYEKYMNEIIISNDKLSNYRKLYNKDVREYRSYCRRTIKSIQLGILGYDMVDYQYLQETSEKADNLDL